MAGTVSAVDGRVVHRVKAMLAPPPTRRLTPVWVLVLLIAVTIATAWGVGESADHLLDSAGLRTAGQTTAGQTTVDAGFRVAPG